MKSKIAIDQEEGIGYDLDTSGVEGGTSTGESDALLTTQEICELLRVPKTYIYWLTHSRRIPHIKLGGHLRFRRSDIDMWLESQEVRSVDIQEKR